MASLQITQTPILESITIIHNHHRAHALPSMNQFSNHLNFNSIHAVSNSPINLQFQLSNQAIPQSHNHFFHPREPANHHSNQLIHRILLPKTAPPLLSKITTKPSHLPTLAVVLSAAAVIDFCPKTHSPCLISALSAAPPRRQHRNPLPKPSPCLSWPPDHRSTPKLLPVPLPRSLPSSIQLRRRPKYPQHPIDAAAIFQSTTTTSDHKIAKPSCVVNSTWLNQHRSQPSPPLIPRHLRRALLSVVSLIRKRKRRRRE
ncbi:hypothetical protein M0R45_028144 [Rubus argutus]|uniref:Uncharacterized protein n=1 Tax=Rubus argutus TaxID=59490 RepID=A0AAW1W6E9_RUBAR